MRPRKIVLVCSRDEKRASVIAFTLAHSLPVTVIQCHSVAEAQKAIVTHQPFAGVLEGRFVELSEFATFAVPVMRVGRQSADGGSDLIERVREKIRCKRGPRNHTFWGTLAVPG